MKIVLVNYRYFVSGGPERYYFNIKDQLERHGHEVIPFSIKGSHNQPSEYEQYFLDSVDDEVYFANTRKSPKVILKSFSRMFWSSEAKRKFRSLLEATHPDLVYIMQFHNKISPSILPVAKKMGIPVVHRISDFQYMCPNALFYNDRIGVCEDCLNGKRLSCIKNKCVLNSTAYSAIKAAAKWYHDKRHITRMIDAFVVPSSFTMTKLARYGIDPSKLNHIPTFFNIKEQSPAVSYGDYFLFVGRIEKQKGLMTLVKAFANTNLKLKIIGFSSDGYIDTLKEYLADKPHNIEFLGKMTFDQIIPYLKECRATIVPSEWYDNFPNVILESFAYKKAVIATAFGSLPELVKDGQTGLTFPYAEAEALRAKARYLESDSDAAHRLGDNAYAALCEKYLSETHYQRLISLFNSLVASSPTL